MPRSLALIMLACALLWPAAFFGCASQDAYRYETIKADYAATAANREPSQPTQPTETLPTTGVIYSNLTLQDVLDIARDNNPDLLMALARIERARAMLDKSAAPFYPQVNVYTEYLQGDAPSAYLFKTIDQRKLPPDTNFNDPGWFENYESGVSAGINLFNGGRDRLNREMAKTGLTISQLDRDGIENQVMATAIGAFSGPIYTTLYGRFETAGHPEYVWYVLAAHVILAIVVLNAAQTESVLFGDTGVVRHMKPGACVMACATMAPENARDLARRCAGGERLRAGESLPAGHRRRIRPLDHARRRSQQRQHRHGRAHQRQRRLALDVEVALYQSG